MEGELLQEVVVEPRAGGDAHRRRAVEREPHAHARLRGRAQVARPAAARRRDGGGRSSARERLDEEVVVLGVAHRDADRAGQRADDDAVAGAAAESIVRLGHGHDRKFARDGSGARPSARRARREPLPLLDLRADVGRVGERRQRQGGRERRDRERRLPPVELGRGLGVGERVAEPRGGESERLRERPEDDDAVVDQPHRGLARVLEVRLVDDERPTAGSGSSAPVGLFGRQANVSAARRRRPRRPRGPRRRGRAGTSGRPRSRRCRRGRRTPARTAGSGRPPPRRGRRSPGPTPA